MSQSAPLNGHKIEDLNLYSLATLAEILNKGNRGSQLAGLPALPVNVARAYRLVAFERRNVVKTTNRSPFMICIYDTSRKNVSFYEYRFFYFQQLFCNLIHCLGQAL